MKKIVAPFLRTPYNYDTNAAGDQDAVHCTDKSLAQQHMLQDTDINVLMERYVQTGEVPQLLAPPLQGDFTNTMTYQEALNQMIEANKAFAALPAKIRSRFDNDPGQFVDFCSDEANRDELRQMGLFSAEAMEVHQQRLDAARAAQEAEKAELEGYRQSKKTKGDTE